MYTLNQGTDTKYDFFCLPQLMSHFILMKTAWFSIHNV